MGSTAGILRQQAFLGGLAISGKLDIQIRYEVYVGSCDRMPLPLH